MSLLQYTNKQLLGVLVFLSLLSVLFDNLILDRVVVGSIFVVCIIMGAREKSFVNPYLLFSLTPLSLVVYFPVSPVYMMEIKPEIWTLAIINMIGFLTAITLVKYRKNKISCIGIPRNKLVFYAIIFYLVSILGRYIPSLSAVLWLFASVSIACSLKSKKKKMLPFVAFVILSSALSGHASKLGILFECVTILVCYEKYYVKTREQRKNIILMVLAGIVIMISAFSFANKDRGDYNSDDGLSYYEKSGKVDWSYDASLFMPYMYLTTAWTNLQYVTETQQTQTYGLWVIKPIMGYLGLDDNYKREYRLFSYSSFNTFTFITCHYKDFGYWGSVVISFLLGLFVMIVYRKYEVSQSVLDVGSYISVALGVAVMFFSNHFFMQSYPFTAYIMFELIKKIPNICVGNDCESEELMENNNRL